MSKVSIAAPHQGQWLLFQVTLQCGGIRSSSAGKFNEGEQLSEKLFECVFNNHHASRQHSHGMESD